MSRILRPCAPLVLAPLFMIVAAQGAAPKASSNADKGIIVLAGHEVRQAALFHQDPEYPATARQFRLNGQVVVELTIGLDGKVENVVVTKGQPIFNDSVIRALRRWSFSPFMVDGHPTRVKSTLSFNFQL